MTHSTDVTIAGAAMVSAGRGQRRGGPQLGADARRCENHFPDSVRQGRTNLGRKHSGAPLKCLKNSSSSAAEAYDDEAVSRFIYDVIGTGTMTSESVTAALRWLSGHRTRRKPLKSPPIWAGTPIPSAAWPLQFAARIAASAELRLRRSNFGKNERPPFQRTGSGRHEDSCSLHALRTKATAMRSIIELIDALDVRKRILIIGSAFVDVDRACAPSAAFG